MNRKVVTIEPCVTEARALADKLKSQPASERHRRLLEAFTALAGYDPSVGLLAYYIWRIRTRL